VGFVVVKVALGQVFSEYFGFPCQCLASSDFLSYAYNFEAKNEVYMSLRLSSIRRGVYAPRNLELG
jgi:hypothetical protein